MRCKYKQTLLEIKQNKLCICVHFYPLLLWGYLELSEIDSRWNICFSAVCHYTTAKEEGFLAVFHLLWQLCFLYGINRGMLVSSSVHTNNELFLSAAILLASLKRHHYLLYLFALPVFPLAFFFHQYGNFSTILRTFMVLMIFLSFFSNFLVESAFHSAVYLHKSKLCVKTYLKLEIQCTKWNLSPEDYETKHD